MRIRVLRLLSQDVVSTGHQNWEIFSLRFKSLVVFSDLRNKVLALVNILKAQSIVSKKKGHEQYSYFQIFLPYELDVVVVSDSPGAVISDPVDNSYANVLNGPQQVLIGNQVSGEYSGEDKTSVESLGGDFSINNAFIPRFLVAK